MKKHKKTRQEKIIADLRRKVQLQENKETMQQNYTFSSNKTKIQVEPVVQTIVAKSQNFYPFLLLDLRKTFILTVGIIVLELLLFFLFKNRVIMLPNISF